VAQVLRLDLGFTSLVTLEPLERLGQCNSLVHLELRFPGCKQLGKNQMVAVTLTITRIYALRILRY
jgi:hypothetical protein